MRHLAHRSLLALAVLGLALTGCAPTAVERPATPASAPQGTDADALCAASESGDDAVCVLENATATDAVTFEGYRVVKLLGGRFAGPVEIRGAEQVVVAETSFSDDLTVDAKGGVVVKQSSIGGSLAIEGARDLTLVQNSIGGDVRCADGVQVDGGMGSCTTVG